MVIPKYNLVHLIAETLQSILAQTYNSGMYIVDDHSNDNI